MIISLLITKLFRYKDKRYDKQVAESDRIKQIKFKTIKDQKTYLRNKSDLGRDFIYTVISIFLFFILFRLLIYPHLPNLLSGIIGSIGFGIVFGAIMAVWVLPQKYFWKNFTTTTLNISFIGSFASYLKFVKTIHPLIIVALTIVLMISIGWMWKKMKL